ncbi:MAG TPA: ATPase, T2SS/T4P/T4SS family, partial [Beijerinckiaceae bacterium]|nr:ATPase, T2SS/T4P/T4SS family [Beijerinckiaceae bacterium]
MLGRFSARVSAKPAAEAPPPPFPALLVAPVEAPRPPMDEADDIAATAIVEAAAPLEAADAITPAVDAPKPVPMAPIAFAESAAGALLGKQKLLDAKVRLHKKLLDELNLAAFEKLPEEELRREVRALISDWVKSERLALNTQELNNFVSEVMDEMTGLGPLEPLLKDPSIADILINGHQNIFVERSGVLEPVPSLFKDEAHLMRIIQKIVSAVGRRVDESSPLCDARLLDGSRFNCAVRPIGVDGPLVSIRKFSKSKLSLDRLVEMGAIRPQMAELLAAAVKARITTIVS